MKIIPRTTTNQIQARADLTGKRFGSLVALRPVGLVYGSQVAWEFRCDCGKVTVQPGAFVKHAAKLAAEGRLTHEYKRNLHCGCQSRPKEGNSHHKGYSYWQSHRHKFATEWQKTAKRFLDECYRFKPKRLQFGHLTATDPTKPIGPGNWQWGESPSKLARQEIVAHVVAHSREMPLDEARALVLSLTRERVRQIYARACELLTSLNGQWNADMAKAIAELPPIRHLRESPYPLDQWFDGKTWELTEGEDFQCKRLSLYRYLHAKAKARGLKLITRTRPGKLYIKAVTFDIPAG